jgi:hypothetical protein
MDAFAAHLASGEIKLQAEGFLISVCTEQEIDSVENLTRQEKNSLKMAVRQRQPGVTVILITAYLNSFNLYP